MKIPTDKLLHVETSAIIVVLISLILPIWVAAIITLLIGVGKEIWDKYHNGTPEWKDILADAIGIGFGSLVSWLTIICNTFV